MNKLQRDVLYGEIPEKSILPTNSIFTIAPYKFGGLYVFDVEEWGTIKEAFVGGATEYLEIISGNADKMIAAFSDKWFPDSHVIFKLDEEVVSGTFYWSEEFQHKLWLCNYTTNYWDISPEKIYVSVKPIN